MNNLCPRPDCESPLDLQSDGEFNTWVCPNDHGFAATISELWGQLQDDEIKEMWQSAKQGETTDLLSPGLRQPMVRVEVAIDEDETVGNAPADAPRITLDVATEEELIWFDLGEFEQFTQDKQNPEDSPQKIAKAEEIAANFVSSWADGVRDRNRLSAVGNKFANAVDPQGTFSRGLSAVIPGESAEEIAKKG